MKIVIIFLISLILGFTSGLQANGDYSVEDLKWLTGCWASVGGEAGSGEQWTMPAGGTLFGVNRTVRNGKTVAYEFMQIRSTDDGGIEFIARPSGQTGASFQMQVLSEDEVVFENPDHDFPQRVIYRLESPGNLAASIEGNVKGEDRTIDFPMKRVDCLKDALILESPESQRRRILVKRLPGGSLISLVVMNMYHFPFSTDLPPYISLSSVAACLFTVGVNVNRSTGCKVSNRTHAISAGSN
jgi:hypothetical protein